jgi:hypothetical protein
MVYLYDACDQISDFCHQQLLRKICTFFVSFFSANIDGRNLIFGHKLHIGMPYCGKRFWIRQIPTSCMPTLLIFKHIEHIFCICPFLVAFFSATIDGRNVLALWWNNCPWVDISLHSDTLSWFQATVFALTPKNQTKRIVLVQSGHHHHHLVECNLFLLIFTFHLSFFF